MSHWLLRLFSTIWYVLFFGILMPVSLLLVSWSLDQLVLDWWGIGLYHNWWLETAGLLLILTGLLLLVLSSWTLFAEGKGYPWSFGSHAAFNPQKLVVSGPYSVMRHPMGTSYLLMLFGLGCLLPSLVMLVWMVPLIAGLFYEYFEFTEERRLLQWFGKDYQKYHTATPSLVPRPTLTWRKLSGRRRRASADV
jgi:protein-S-isoprenylcysteine O-methyltransferase Ste14